MNDGYTAAKAVAPFQFRTICGSGRHSYCQPLPPEASAFLDGGTSPTERHSLA